MVLRGRHDIALVVDGDLDLAVLHRGTAPDAVFVLLQAGHVAHAVSEGAILGLTFREAVGAF